MSKAITCMDCGKLLARLNQTVVTNVASSSLCYDCANVRYSNIKRGHEIENEGKAC